VLGYELRIDQQRDDIRERRLAATGNGGYFKAALRLES
jgi:hypothetical protein